MSQYMILLAIPFVLTAVAVGLLALVALLTHRPTHFGDAEVIQEMEKHDETV